MVKRKQHPDGSHLQPNKRSKHSGPLRRSVRVQRGQRGIPDEETGPISTFRFLDLPRELRDQIQGEAMAHTSGILFGETIFDESTTYWKGLSINGNGYDDFLPVVASPRRNRIEYHHPIDSLWTSAGFPPSAVLNKQVFDEALELIHRTWGFYVLTDGPKVTRKPSSTHLTLRKARHLEQHRDKFYIQCYAAPHARKRGSLVLGQQNNGHFPINKILRHLPHPFALKSLTLGFNLTDQFSMRTAHRRYKSAYLRESDDFQVYFRGLRQICWNLMHVRFIVMFGNDSFFGHMKQAFVKRLERYAAGTTDSGTVTVEHLWEGEAETLRICRWPNNENYKYMDQLYVIEAKSSSYLRNEAFRRHELLE